jgi:oligopeptide transport system ATP-binding protein
VDHIALSLAEGETVALVGESGSGKSTLGRMLLGLIPPTEGTLRYQGVELADLKGDAWRSYRSEVQAVFQDTSASLNPRRTIEDSVSAPLIYNLGQPVSQAKAESARILDRVGLDPTIFNRRYPHQLSGGQRQRVGLARALASRPRLLVADEPVSALDVSVRAQILKLMIQLQEQEQLTMLFITHDLGVARWIARRVIVMYLGASVEEGATEDVFAHPYHPYTRALITAAPVPDPERPRPIRTLKGDIPSPLAPPSGCRFHPRCPIAQPICSEQPPKTVHARDQHGDHQAACHFANLS